MLRLRSAVWIGAGMLGSAVACTEFAGSQLLAPSASEFSASTPADTDYVMTPSGRYHKSCVHVLPTNARLDKRGVVTLSNGHVQQTAPCMYPVQRAEHGKKTVVAPTANGYIELAIIFDSVYSFNYIRADWKVPNNPTSSYSSAGKVYYTFPGLQPASASDIAQPVLSYGNNGSYGGAYWSIAAWICGSTYGCYHSGHRSVAVGDSLQGTVANGCTWGGWEIRIADLTANTSESMCVADLDYRQAIGGAVEVYGLTSCNEFPATAPVFKNIVVYSSADYFSPMTGISWGIGVSSPTSPSCTAGVSATSSTVTMTL